MSHTDRIQKPCFFFGGGGVIYIILNWNIIGIRSLQTFSRIYQNK